MDFCKSKGVVLEAYAPLSRGHKLDNPLINKIAESHGKTPAQIMIRWGLQHGLVEIPKSKLAKRIKENADVFDFELSDSDMQKLNGLNNNMRTCWDPTDAP